MLRTVELFAGVGGFRLGLEKLNTGTPENKQIKVIWSNQWEPGKKEQFAFDCYVKHFNGEGVHINEDIAVVNQTGSIPEHELLVGGFPCQDYSVARTLNGEKGIQGKKGVLFWEIMKVVDLRRPPYVLLENVDRLLKSPANQRGRDFSVMLACFADRGYSVEWRVINAADYGFPQKRRRVFIFAIRSDMPFANECAAAEPKEVLLEKGFFAPAFPIKECSSPINASTELPLDTVRISDTFSYKYYEAGFMFSRQIWTTRFTPINFPMTTLGSVLENDVSDERFYLSPEIIEKFKYLKGAKRIVRTARNGHTYLFSEGGIPFPESVEQPGRTMLTSEGTTNRSTHIVADPGNGRLRKLTPLECERLNGFPDDWTAGMPDRWRYFCMGNALVVGLIEKMALRLREII